MKSIYYKIGMLVSNNLSSLLIFYAIVMEVVLIKYNFTGVNVFVIIALRLSQYITLYYILKLKILDVLYIYDKKKEIAVARSYKQYWQVQLKNIENIDFHDDDILEQKKYVLSQIAYLERTYNV